MLALVSVLLLSHSPKFGAWVILDDDGTSLSTFDAHARQIDSVSAQFYQCTPDGLVRHVDGIPEDKFKQAVTIAHKHRVPIYGLVGNPNFDASLVELFLADQLKRDAQADALCSAAVADRLDGVDVDYENMKAEDRENFSLFMETLATKLHARHKLLAIALHSKESEPGDWNGPQSEDYVRIGKVVDRARIMTYDQHEDSSPAGPVADIAWVERNMNYAISAIPKKKLEMGIPAYGYDWSPTKPISLDWSHFSVLPGFSGATRDPASNEMVVTSATGAAWFCDSVSEAPKLDLARKLGIRGVYMWRLGSEDPKLWSLIR